MNLVTGRNWGNKRTAHLSHVKMTRRLPITRALRTIQQTWSCRLKIAVTRFDVEPRNLCFLTNPAAVRSSINIVQCAADKARTSFNTSATPLSGARDDDNGSFFPSPGDNKVEITVSSDRDTEVVNPDGSPGSLLKRPPTAKYNGPLDLSLGETQHSRLRTGVDWHNSIELVDAIDSPRRTRKIDAPFTLSASSADDNTESALHDACRFRFEVTESDLVPEGLPKSLAEEFATSGTGRVMIRDVDARLWDKIQRRRSTLLHGGQGAGKTVSCVNLVARARKAGWHVLYVPSARALTIHSSYHRDDGSGMWDTPDHARLLLKWTQAALAVSSEPDPADVDAVSEGLESSDREANVVVNAALRVIENAKRRARAGSKVLFVVDEYNSLFGMTDMHEVLGPRKRGNIEAGKTRLCAALRNASDIVRSGAVYVGATSKAVQPTFQLSESLGGERGRGGSEVLEREKCQRFSTNEILGMVQHYEAAKSGLGAVHPSVDGHQLSMRLRVLTQGNGTEIRQLCAML